MLKKKILTCFRHNLIYCKLDQFYNQVLFPCVQLHPWVTRHGAEPLPLEDDNCCMLIEVTEEEVENSVKHIPSLATVVSLSASFCHIDGTSQLHQLHCFCQEQVKLICFSKPCNAVTPCIPLQIFD